MLHELRYSKIELISNLREPIDQIILKQFQKNIQRHADTKVPVQHITGVEMFYGRTFYVNQDVLIPRPETEELVFHLLAKVTNDSFSCVDVGTGSGIIAVSLAKEWADKTVKMIATDLSDKALHIAQRNANQHQTDIEFFQGDFLQPLINHNRKVDIIISNPPYIAYEEAASLSETVRNFDPELALFAEDNGLAAYQQIIEQAPLVLNKNGILAFEIGHTQGKAVTNLIKYHFPNSKVEVIPDINQKNRIVFATT